MKSALARLCASISPRIGILVRLGGSSSWFGNWEKMNHIENQQANDDEDDYDEDYVPKLSVTRRYVPHEWDEPDVIDVIVYKYLRG